MNRLIFVVAIVTMLSCQKEVKPFIFTLRETPPIEIGDSSLIALCQTTLDGFSSGNMDLFAENIADNCVYRWNAGDSLAGKAAIMDYWKARRKDVVDTVVYSNHIWVPLVVNASTNAALGNTVLAWMQADAVYKSGKPMSQWIHFVYHFNNDRKIDFVLQFIDRAPVQAAMMK